MGILKGWNGELVEAGASLLLQAADAEGCLKGPSWSLAEVRLSDEDLNLLLKVAYRSVPHWDVILRRDFDPPRGGFLLPESLGTLLPDRKECLGLLLLALISGLSRRHADSAGCFTAIRGTLPRNVADLLMQGSSLHRLVQQAIEAACLRFHLRMAGSEHSKQRWYLTVRLNEVFPGVNLEQRLPGWLHGMSVPLHLQLMLSPGPLHSQTLFRLWSELMLLARGKASPDKVRQRMADSPWFLGHDIDALIDAIIQYVPPYRASSGLWSPPSLSPQADSSTSPGAVSQQTAEEDESEVSPPLRLDVSGGLPQLQARPAAASLAGELTEAVYEVQGEGEVLGSLLLNPDGTYDWAEEAWRPVPMRSVCVLQLVDEQGRSVPGDRSLRLFSDEDVLAFDAQGQRVTEVRDTSQGFWWIAPAGASWSGAPEGAGTWPREDCTLLWLPPGWSPSVRMMLDGEERWGSGVPYRERPPWLEQIQLHEDPQQPLTFRVEMPASVALVGARIRGQRLVVAPGSRLTFPAGSSPVEDVSLLVQAGVERWFVRRRVVVRNALLVPAGPAGWRECRPGEALDLGQFRGTSVRVCARQNQGYLFFEQALGWKVSPRASALSGLPGRGELLSLGPQFPQQDGELSSLGVSVVDRGLVQGCSAQGGQWTLHLRHKIQPQPGHRVILWRRGQLPEVRPVIWSDGARIEIEPPATGGTWDVVALIFNSEWLGSWWGDDWWQVIEQAPDLRELFLWLRWLRLPVLSPQASETVRDCIRRSPANALIAWVLLPREEAQGEGESPDLVRARQDRYNALMRLSVQGGELTPALSRQDEVWLQAVRQLLFKIGIGVSHVSAMYDRVHAELLHRNTSRALLPWGALLLGVSARWPADACAHTSYRDRANAEGRRSQWRNIFLFLDPTRSIKDKHRALALQGLVQRAAMSLCMSEAEVRRLLDQVKSDDPCSTTCRAALHHEPFRRLAASVLLAQPPREVA